MSEPGDFRALVADTRTVVDAALPRFLELRLDEARRAGPDAEAVATAVSDLAIRGGKRQRAALVVAAYTACGGEGGATRVLPALVAIELLQAYLLVHDDWMDDDAERRGGPSVHVVLRERFGSSRDGDVGAILAGDLAVGWALEALGELGAGARLPPARVADALRVFGRMSTEVVLGQTLDVRGARDLEKMHDLKTGSYTVRGPLGLGAALAGASEEVALGLRTFAQPLGIAFQVRDDLLGTFGDPSVTGKGASSDVRQGKRTALVAALAETGTSADRALLDRVLGNASADENEVRALVERFVASGARASVEAKLAALLARAREALATLPIDERGRALLAGAIDALGLREA